jgi:hypothetical protein
VPLVLSSAKKWNETPIGGKEETRMNSGHSFSLSYINIAIISSCDISPQTPILPISKGERIWAIPLTRNRKSKMHSTLSLVPDFLYWRVKYTVCVAA